MFVFVEIFADMRYNYKIERMIMMNNSHEEEKWECFSSTEIEEDVDDVFGTFGFKDKDGNVVIEPQYLSCGEFHCGLCPVALGRTWYKTPDGRRFYEMHWGYINKYGKVVIPFKYREASIFNKYGVAVVCDEYEEYSYMIDTDGKEIPNTKYPYLSPYYEYSDRFVEFSEVDAAHANDDDSYGLYDTKNRKVMYPPTASEFIEWNEELILVYESGEMGDADFHQHYINSKGEVLFPWLMNKGYAEVNPPNEYGFAIISFFEFIEAHEAVSKYFIANGERYIRKEKYGVAGTDGELEIPADYDKIKDLEDGSFECVKGLEKIIIKPMQA